MGSSEEYWSRCNEKLSSIVKSTSLSLLLTSLIFLSVSTAPSSEGRRCHWCGPLAEQVHRSRRARPCTAPLQETECETEHYCATVATAPPYTESRLCVKVYQDECYPLYCNTTRTYKMTCPCRGDFCNGPNTPREEAAFKQLRQLATSARNKRAIDDSEDDSSSSTTVRTSQDYQDKEMPMRHDDHENGETTVSTLTSSERGQDSEVNPENSDINHATQNNDINRNEQPNSETERDTNADDTKAETTTQAARTGNEENASSTGEKNEVDAHTTMSTEVVNSPSDISDPNNNHTITSEQDCTDSAETYINMSSEKPSEDERVHLSNEISKEDAVDSIEAPKVDNAKIDKADNNDITPKPKDEDPKTDEVDNNDVTPKPNEIVNDDKNPTPEHVHVDLNEITSSDDATTIKEEDENKNSKSDHQTTSEVPSHDSNELHRHETSEASPNELTITRRTSQDKIESLDQKVEGYADEVGSNFNDACDTGTCKASGPSTAHVDVEKKPETTAVPIGEAKVTQPNVREVITQKPTMPTEANVAKDLTETPTMHSTATTVTGKPAESATTVSTTLPSKVELTTNPTTTFGNKMSNKTKGKNSGISASGSMLLLANTVIVVLVL